MSANLYESDVQQLRYTSEKIGTAADEMKSEIQLLKSYIERLSSLWTGSASDRLVSGFVQEYESLDEAVKDINELYEDLKSVCQTDEKNENLLEELVAGMNF